MNALVKLLFRASLPALLLGLSGASPLAANAAEIDGVSFADQVTVAGKKLTLNGLGLRQATIFKVNVYAGALYVETPSHDADQIAKSGGLKRMEMAFMRDVDAGKIAGAWAEGFEKNCTENCDAMKPGLAKLQTLTTDMKKGDRMAFDFLPDRVEMTIRGAKAGSIEDKGFGKNLILLWIGRNPPNAGLKVGLLGGKD